MESKGHPDAYERTGEGSRLDSKRLSGYASRDLHGLCTRAVANHGALPRLRGRGEQRDLVALVIVLED